MPAFVKLAPILLRVIVGLVVWATNRYHTSLVTVPAQSGAVIFVGVVKVEA